VDWDGKPGGRKIARLAVGVAETTLETEAVCDKLRSRQRVEILIKFLHRRLQLSNFGGGKAVARADERVCPSDEEALKKLETERKKTDTRLRKAKARLEQVEAELEHLTADEKNQPRNSLGLGVQDLRSLGKRLRGQIERATAKLQDLKALIAWGRGQGPAPEQETAYELDLTREAILTQLKLDVFTAYETLVDEFIELALKPVLREEAEHQAAERRRLDKRSTAKEREGEPLCTDPVLSVQDSVWKPSIRPRSPTWNGRRSWNGCSISLDVISIILRNASWSRWRSAPPTGECKLPTSATAPSSTEDRFGFP